MYFGTDLSNEWKIIIANWNQVARLQLIIAIGFM